MALPNHNPVNEDKPIYQMVLYRIPTLLDNANNTELISIIIYEFMYELEPFLNITEREKGEEDANGDPVLDAQNNQVMLPASEDNIGDEEWYTVQERSMIADLVAAQILLLMAAGGVYGDESTGGGSGGGATGTYLSKAKAGSAEVEYAQFDVGKASSAEDSLSILQGTAALIRRYKRNAIRKGHQMGYIIDINEDTHYAIELVLQTTPPVPFLAIGFRNC